MKAKEVMKILNICRSTLYNYTKDKIDLFNKYSAKNICSVLVQLLDKIIS